jgi:hypothetical protein
MADQGFVRGCARSLRGAFGTDWRLLPMAIAALALAACGSSIPSSNAAAGSAGSGAMSIKVLSGRADLVSGGEALVQVVPPDGADASAIKMSLNGQDVTSQFALRQNGQYEGLLNGIAEGNSTLKAVFPDGSGAALPLTDYPNGGPIFAGEQIQPWPCNAGALDSQCNQAVTYQYMYVPAGTSAVDINAIGMFVNTLQAYDPANPPAASQIASTTTDAGVTVPFIIRIETGAQDRGVYQIAVLYDPSQDWQPWAPQSGWNGKVLTTGGEGCGTHHGQGPQSGLGSYPSVSNGFALGLGFAVAMTSLDHNTLNCNLVVQGEALMMLKQRITEAYGPIRYTIGSGCSGGAIYQQQVANAYPGIFDGILPNCSFPDSFSTAIEVVDCALLLNYFDNPAAWGSGVVWLETAEAEVMGHPDISICASWIDVYSFDTAANPREETGLLGLNTQACGVPAAAADDPTTAYDPQINPGGVRCNLQDYMVSILGRRAQDGFANNPLDNVGVQYGLAALANGSISADQFIDLNAKIGGRDIDYNLQAARSVADAAALPVTYRAGLINEANNLSEVAIIDIRGHDIEEIHHDVRSYSMRARLDRAQGNHDNQVIWTGPIPLVGDLTFANNSLSVMDTWLENVEADTSSATRAQKIAADKPAMATDLCTDGAGNIIPSETLCRSLYPYYAEPRIVAGDALTADNIKCVLKPLAASDYLPTVFTTAQWAQLQAIFPNGVCDYTQPGVGQQPTQPWMNYSAGPGGAPMPGAPESIAIGG